MKHLYMNMQKWRCNRGCLEELQNEEVFTEDDDYLDWRFAKEAIGRLLRQKRELEYA